VSVHESKAAALIVLALGLTEACGSSRRPETEDADRDSGRAGTSSRAAGRDGSTSPEPDAGAAGAGAAAGAGGAASQWSLTLDGADVVAGEAYITCSRDVDCTLVSSSCNGCCGQHAIIRAREMTYQRELEAACRDYEGPICDCEPKDLVPRCVNGRCGAFERSDACFSPTQNAELAFGPGVPACACEIEGQRICVGGKPLGCLRVSTAEPVTSHLEWGAFSPDRCPENLECPALNVRRTAEACLAEYVQCSERDDHTFCGEQCHGPLDCTALACDDYEPPSTFTCDPEGGPWESVCSGANVRYRVDHTGETRYWDYDSGALIAVMSPSAANSACNGSDRSVFLGDTSLITSCPVLTDDGAAICLRDRCSDTTATRVADSCEFELSAPLQTGKCWLASVELVGQALTCDDANGWTALDRFHIRLDGTACEQVQAADAVVVRVRVPCHLLPI